jgi:hypothetical protein
MSIDFTSNFGGSTAVSSSNGLGIATIDGSAMTGKLTVDTLNALVAYTATTVKGGSGADTITLSALSAKGVVDAGAGADKITTAADSAKLTGGAGNDTFNVTLSIAHDGSAATGAITASIATTITTTAGGSTNHSLSFKGGAGNDVITLTGDMRSGTNAAGAVVPGVEVTLVKALAATYTGSLVGTTDAEGRVIFTLVNTNTDANAESFRSDLTVWSDSTNGVGEGDFHPYITSAGTGACYSAANGACARDRVWTHVVASTVTAVPTPTTSPIFVSFGTGDSVGTASAANAFGGGAAASSFCSIAMSLFAGLTMMKKMTVAVMMLKLTWMGWKGDGTHGGWLLMCLFLGML